LSNGRAHDLTQRPASSVDQVAEETVQFSFAGYTDKFAGQFHELCFAENFGLHAPLGFAAPFELLCFQCFCLWAVFQ